MSQPTWCMKFLGQIPSKCSTRSAHNMLNPLAPCPPPKRGTPDCPTNANSSKPVARLVNQLQDYRCEAPPSGALPSNTDDTKPTPAPPQKAQHPIEDGNTMQSTQAIPASNLQARLGPLEQRPQPSRSFTTSPYTIDTEYSIHLFRVVSSSDACSSPSLSSSRVGPDTCGVGR